MGKFGISGDLDLNYVHNCTDSIKQRLKQTMLNQDLVFMRQVCELHQLYRIQRTMMEDFKQKGMNSYNVHTNITERSMAELTHFQNEWHRLPGFIQRPLDLQLSADEFINCSADHLLGKGFLGGSLNESFKSQNSSRGEVLDVDDLNISLRTRRDAREKIRYHRSWFGKKTRPSSLEIIGLEDPNVVFSNNDVYLEKTSTFVAPNTSSKDKHVLERVSQTGMRNISNGSRLTTSLDVGSLCQKLSPDSGFTAQMSTDFLCKNKKSKTHIGDNLDMNVKLEESSCFSNDLALNRSKTSFSSATPTYWQRVNVKQCPETRHVPRQLDLNVDLAVTYGDKINFIDLDSDSGDDLCSSKFNFKFESVGSLSKPLNGVSCDVGMVDVIRTEENLVKDAGRLALSHSSSVKTMQPGVKCRDLNRTASDESQRDDNNRRSPESIESNIQCIIGQEPDVDEMVEKAVESLVQISLQSREMASKNEDIDQPECSSDSYADMVLMRKESDPDDYCVSSNAFVVVDELEKKENRYKLKRGTRMKDFQKDILPGLSILLRHEIHEDINIMEGIIRSREYKKMRSKYDDGGDWCRTTRSKRSRICCSRR